MVGDNDAGSPSAAKLGVSMWPTMTMGQPASMAARKGTSSQPSICSRVRVAQTAPVCESPAVSPWPGKCLAQGSVPVSSIAPTSDATMRATRSGSLPNERSPITVLAGLVSTSATGAKSTSKPMSRR